MATNYTNFITGTLSADPGSGGVTINGLGLAYIPALTSPETQWIVLDPEGVNGAPEIVQVTAHTASATSATVTRAQQSTTARAHPIGTVFNVSVTKSDLDQLPFRLLTTRGDIVRATAANTAARLAVGSASTVLGSDGTDPSWGQVATAMIADNAVSTAKIADDAVTSAKIAALTIATGDIADDAITAAKIATGAVGAPELGSGAVGTANLAAAVVELLCPAGTVSQYLGVSAPSGWLFHNQAVGSCDTTYPTLWSVAPASWKSGSTLTIPNLSDATLVQQSTTALGASGGANSRTIATGNLPSHTHTLGSHTHTINHSHTASVTVDSNTVDRVTRLSAAAPNRYIAIPDTDGDGYSNALPADPGGMVVYYETDHTHTGSATVSTHSGSSGSSSDTSGSTGSGTALDTTPKHLAVNIIIKAH